jgi:glucosamine--fructose-6-phosphate aminotransferase (isomerizing)
LAQIGDLVLLADAAQEQSIVQTRSLTSMAILALGLIGTWADVSVESLLPLLPAVGERLLNDYHGVIREIGAADTIDRFFFLGSGYYRGFASEAMLKMKEMSFTQSEAFHTLEFRHGLGANVTSSSLIVGLLSERVQQHELAVLAEMRALGASALVFSESQLQDAERDDAIAMNSALPDWMRLVLPLPLLQLLAYYRARKNGLDPDVPANLKSHITLPSLRS